jgi:hypothetical protein
MRMFRGFFLIAASAFVEAAPLPVALAQTAAGALVPVTVEDFVRAETDLFFGNAVKGGGFGKFQHRRAPMGVDDQFVVRGNRDTLYSIAVFDLEAGPVTITMPDAGKRFMSLQVIDEDEYVPNVYYGAGFSYLDP